MFACKSATAHPPPFLFLNTHVCVVQRLAGKRALHCIEDHQRTVGFPCFTGGGPAELCSHSPRDHAPVAAPPRPLPAGDFSLPGSAFPRILLHMLLVRRTCFSSPSSALQAGLLSAYCVYARVCTCYSMCRHICAFAFVCVCEYWCPYTPTCVYVCICVYMCEYMCISVHTFTCVCVRVCVHTHMEHEWICVCGFCVCVYTC